MLNQLADWMKKLAGKAIDALPGVIGSILSSLFKAAATVIKYVADNLWTLGVAVVLLFAE
mgnify:CR=1 FL=1